MLIQLWLFRFWVHLLFYEDQLIQFMKLIESIIFIFTQRDILQEYIDIGEG